MQSCVCVCVYFFVFVHVCTTFAAPANNNLFIVVMTDGARLRVSSLRSPSDATEFDLRVIQLQRGERVTERHVGSFPRRRMRTDAQTVEVQQHNTHQLACFSRQPPLDGLIAAIAAARTFGKRSAKRPVGLRRDERTHRDLSIPMPMVSIRQKWTRCGGVVWFES